MALFRRYERLRRLQRNEKTYGGDHDTFPPKKRKEKTKCGKQNPMIPFMMFFFIFLCILRNSTIPQIRLPSSTMKKERKIPSVETTTNNETAVVKKKINNTFNETEYRQLQIEYRQLQPIRHRKRKAIPE